MGVAKAFLRPPSQTYLSTRRSKPTSSSTSTKSSPSHADAALRKIRPGLIFPLNWHNGLPDCCLVHVGWEGAQTAKCITIMFSPHFLLNRGTKRPRTPTQPQKPPFFIKKCPHFTLFDFTTRVFGFGFGGGAPFVVLCSWAAASKTASGGALSNVCIPSPAV